MDKKVYLAIKGYAELDDEQRKEVREKIQEFEEIEYSFKRTALLESLQKSLGPLSQDICPRCGR